MLKLFPLLSSSLKKYCLMLLKKVGFSATPQDGISEVRSIVDHICEKKGGEGAFREIADIFLRYIS